MGTRLLPAFPGRFVGLALLLSLILAMPAAATDVSFRSDTLLRLFDRGDDTVAPAYEYLRADVGNPDECFLPWT